ncbi:hypothetical protein RBWH47_03404 [Rhodopirellula baltica WH47]|uniref:Uncharacterized protein n=2 Tax=Rhodopirellula baltica TaxID=265606 RepID=F2AZF3_RHOBT|nr:hypothetical protein RBWH47_03404 [Rhodopirellula baltica WH47]ELP32376.1 hypothetical protein RBSWK_03680 [Rhodopirellula baltica SWK14]
MPHFLADTYSSLVAQRCLIRTSPAVASLRVQQLNHLCSRQNETRQTGGFEKTK